MDAGGVESGSSRPLEGGDTGSVPRPGSSLGSRVGPWAVFVPSALVVAAAGLLHGLGVVSGRESAGVLTALNSLFCAAPGLLVAFLSARAYLGSPRRTLLLLGTAGLVFGLLYLVAGPLITAPNQAVTVHNSGLLLSAVLFTASGVCALREEPLKRRRVLPPPGRLVPSYVIAALFVGALTVLAVTGLTSPFYVVGEGPTVLRQTVPGLATVGLTAAAVLFTVTARRSGSLFAWLVAAALCAVAVGVGVLVVSAASPGSPTAWVGRASQWIGGLYLLAGVFTLDRPLGEQALLLQRALRASEERFRAVVEGSPLGIFVQTGGRYAYVNPQGCRMLGASRPEELLGMQVLDRIAPEYREVVRERIRILDEERRALPGIEETLLTLDGERIEVEVSAVPFTYAGQNGALVFMSDISERKRAEEALRRSEEQLRQSQKMEAVGRLAGGVAHDFNNLLTAIIGYSDLILAREAGGDLTVAEDVGEIKRAAERAAELTRQILAFSRRQALRPERISLNDLLLGMEPLLRRALGEDIELSCLYYADLGLVEVDVAQFEQVIMNLAVNARDAMPEGGRLTLETANVELDESYCLTHPEATPGRYVMLSVTDTGVGMEAEILPHIFEPFFTTKPPGKGTGLGLSTVYGIVRQSGGLINVYSEPGQGTSFKVYLPRLAAELEERAAPPAAAPRPGGGESVLVVEDEESLRDLINRVLGGLGYQVKAAASGPEALALAAEMEGPDLLLTDVILPGGMQGNQLAEEMRASRPGLRVLYMSGYTRNAIVHAGRLDEGVNFLEKPFTPDRLAAAVRETLERT